MGHRAWSIGRKLRIADVRCGMWEVKFRISDFGFKNSMLDAGYSMLDKVFSFY
jgi:hypothetical protein